MIGKANNGPRPATLSVRLSCEERARLEANAGGRPLGSYIKAVLFADGAPVLRAIPRPPVREERALSQVLARLGASRMANNLNQLAHAANTGSLVCDEEVRAMLTEAVADIRLMRSMLVAALGLRGPAPAPQPNSPPVPPPPVAPRKAFSLSKGERVS